MSITSSLFPSELHFTAISTRNKNYNHSGIRTAMAAPILCCSNSTASTPPISKTVPPLVMKQRKRYRKLYPGEAEGITEEMRFVAMRLRNVKGKYVHKSGNSSEEDEEGSMSGQNPSNKQEIMEEEEGDEAETWFPTIEGFIKYLVDSKLVFDTIERVVDESSDVAYSYFRKTGLERSECLSKDLDWFSRQNFIIPEPSTAGVSYVKYLDELAEKSAPLFLCHFYNIYFSHIAGGQVIIRQVSEKIIEGRELEFCKWEGDVEESLKGVREKLNMLGEHWTRDEKNKCLKETTKSFRFMGQIIRLIIL